jgi:hypothetical protein
MATAKKNEILFENQCCGSELFFSDAYPDTDLTLALISDPDSDPDSLWNTFELQII